MSKSKSVDPDKPEGRRNLIRQLEDGLAEQTPESDAVGFCFAPGFYYLAMWFINIPPPVSKFRKGGDMTFQCWRKLDEPNLWHMTYRFRHYRGKDAWNGEDEKHWHVIHMGVENEQKILTRMRHMLNGLRDATGEAWDILLLQTDAQGAMDRIVKKPPFWMQIKTMPWDPPQARTE